MTEYIKIENVDFGYNSQLILKDVNLTINKDDYMVIEGYNGSGKSTLVKLILGELQPLSGTITRFSHQNYNWKENDIGYIPQGGLTSQHDFPCSVYELLMMNSSKNTIFSFYNKSNDILIKESLKRVQMEEYADNLLSELSGGQLQKVLIAKELMNQPKILFLDEPNNGLDKNSMNELHKLLLKLHNEGITIVMITHHLFTKDGINKYIEVDDGFVKVMYHV